MVWDIAGLQDPWVAQGDSYFLKDSQMPSDTEGPTVVLRVVFFPHLQGRGAVGWVGDPDMQLP